MASTPLTGTYGSIKASNGAQHVVGEITQWSYSEVAATRSYQSNITSGHRSRAVGGKDKTGEFSYLLNTESGGRRRFEAGDTFTAIFAIDAAFTHTIVQALVIESVDVNVDIDGDGLIGGRCRWGATAAPSFTGAFAVNSDITSST